MITILKILKMLPFMRRPSAIRDDMHGEYVVTRNCVSAQGTNPRAGRRPSGLTDDEWDQWRKMTSVPVEDTLSVNSSLVFGQVQTSFAFLFYFIFTFVCFKLCSVFVEVSCSTFLFKFLLPFDWSNISLLIFITYRLTSETIDFWTYKNTFFINFIYKALPL